MPELYALDFMRFCQRNPKPCPLTGVSDTGNPMMPTIGHDIDIHRDVPACDIYRDGVLERSATEDADVPVIWHQD